MHKLTNGLISDAYFQQNTSHPQTSRQEKKSRTGTAKRKQLPQQKLNERRKTQTFRLDSPERSICCSSPSLSPVSLFSPNLPSPSAFSFYLLAQRGKYRPRYTPHPDVDYFLKINNSPERQSGDAYRLERKKVKEQ